MLGTGVDICYPREHIEQYMLMQRRGAVISEYAPGSRGFRVTLPDEIESSAVYQMAYL